ncbi:MAG TPA: hypothetical protein VN203_07185, partial [Candidatus Acidoferrum sp.]|nr:hypothetical protein [Candidatus Acidoferrum sp.]
MLRRKFLRTSALIGAGALASELVMPVSALAGQAAGPANAAGAGEPQKAPTSAKGRPIRIRMGGYGPPNTGFSLA